MTPGRASSSPDYFRAACAHWGELVSGQALINKILKASEIFRKRYGNLRGSIFWFDLLREKLYRKGSVFSVRIPTVQHRVYLRAHSSDVEALCQIFCHGELDVPISHLVNYVIDAGANIGLTSIFLANRYPGARIDALEVDSENVRLLLANTASYTNIHVLEKGLWSRAARLKILNPDAEAWAFRVEEGSSADQKGIPAVGVQDLIAIRNCDVDILKIDIEGSEVEVLGNAEPWIDHVKTMFVELHDRIKPGCSEALTQAIGNRHNVKVTSGEYHVITLSPN